MKNNFLKFFIKYSYDFFHKVIDIENRFLSMRNPNLLPAKQNSIYFVNEIKEECATIYTLFFYKLFVRHLVCTQESGLYILLIFCWSLHHLLLPNIPILTTNLASNRNTRFEYILGMLLFNIRK